MSTRFRFAMAMLFVFLFASSLIGQRTPAITASPAGANVRFLASASVCQMRVQIFSVAGGEPLFDSTWKDGNVLDWQVESAGQPLTSGPYRCRVMVRDLDGQVSEKEMTLIAKGGEVSIEPSEDHAGKTTLLVHDGTNGSIVSTGGDLSFRFGDFLAGKDNEKMRLTADGELRVDGLIRASQGIEFADGTILSTAAGLPGVAASNGGGRRDGNVGRPVMPPVLGLLPPAAQVKRFTPRPNFAPAYQFVVGDAGVSVGTTNPAYKLDVKGPINTFQEYDIAGTVFAHNFGTGNTFLGQNAGNFTMTGSNNSGNGWEALQSNTTGGSNTGTGWRALYANTTGGFNTANGLQALGKNIGGSSNTATGFDALYSNTVGNSNTADGYGALYFNTGSYNTAEGYQALSSNTSGLDNTAVGYQALYTNTVGYSNTATGLTALYSNTTGNYNSATGEGALSANNVGDHNTAEGYRALLSNTAGSENTATGVQALFANSTGNSNTVVGYQALSSNTIGSNNIAVGSGAGSLAPSNLSGSIFIGNSGTGFESVSTIKIGKDQLYTIIAGIRGDTISGGVAVLVDANGQLGTVSSSRRYKFDINSMDDATDNLMRLRPVTFRYLAHGDNAPLQYGLIAEEVDEVYPELVAHNKDGEVDAVMYQFLAPMLLNEVQKQHRQIEEQQEVIGALERRLEALERQSAQK